MSRLAFSLSAALAFSLVSVAPVAQGQASSANCPSAPVMDHGQPANGKPLASPAATANVSLGGKALSVHYNAPSVRCRTVMGELVPYGKVWRTGANPATSFSTAADLMIDDLRVPAGNYTLYTLPAAPGTPWQLIVSKETGQWGTVYHQDRDLGRTPMQAKELSTPQEVMSLSFEKTNAGSTQLHVRWEKVDEWVEVRLAK